MDLSVSPGSRRTLVLSHRVFLRLIWPGRNCINGSSIIKFQARGAFQVPWLIFGIYLAIPIALFWLMDRMNALNDTSLFAALLVGLAYPAILAGGFGGLKASAGVQDVFKPIEAFTDSVIKSVTKATARNDKRFEDFVVAQMRSDRDVFDEVLGLAKSAVVDVAALEKQLADLDSAGTTDSALLLQKKARVIYLHLSGTPDFVGSLTKCKKLMKGRFWKSPIFQTRVAVGLMILIFAAALSAGIYYTTRPSFSVGHDGWRLTKSNSSEADRFRARENLRRFVVDSDMGKKTYQQLARILRSPRFARSARGHASSTTLAGEGPKVSRRDAMRRINR